MTTRTLEGSWQNDTAGRAPDEMLPADEEASPRRVARATRSSAGAAERGNGGAAAGRRRGGRGGADRVGSGVAAARLLDRCPTGHLRLAAEFDNYRKRIERERAEAWARAQADLAGRLLDALDDLERVAQHAGGSTAEALLQGVQLVERKLRQALQAAGLERSRPRARASIRTPWKPSPWLLRSRDEDDIVSDVFQRGYRFKGTLLRPARVRVKKHGI
jgi:molecular chaperone GrpE